MTRRIQFLRTTAVTLAALAGAASLAACNKSDGATVAQAGAGPALPLTVADSKPSAMAPAVEVLPAARDVSIARVADGDDQYAYLDQAYWQGDAFEDAPPDYTFDYDGVRPWVWQSANNAYEFAEPIGDGYRYYSYRAGADWPYLVRDSGYAYGYDRGQLVAIYDPSGRALDRAALEDRRDYAGRYLARAEQLYRAARSDRRQAVSAASWAASRARIAAERAAWSADRSRVNAWRSYDAAHAAQQASYWNDERDRRRQSAQAFSQWRRDDFRGPPPAPVTFAAARDAGRDRGRDFDRDAQVRQAQADAARVDAQRAADDQRRMGDDRRRFADEQRARQDQDRQDQVRDQARRDQARQQADNQRRQDENQRQQAENQRRQQADQQRQQQEQARNQAQQRREQDRQQAENQRRQADDQHRQQADQQRQQRDQARQQAENQRQQADNQRRQQAEQQRQQHDQQRQQAQQQRDQQRQQADQQRQQAQQQRQQDHDKGGPRPAGHDEHREKKHD